MSKKNALERIDDQISGIESIIAKLMEDVDINELSSAERLNIATKFMAQRSRLLVLRISCEADQPEQRDNILLSALARQLRGEVVVEEQ